jgi:TP901 family phage tail tape measure protein
VLNLANINSTITYNANLSAAQAQIKALTTQIGTLTAAFNTLDKAALSTQRSLAATFAANVGQIGGFTAQTVKATDAVETFGKRLASNKLTMREYFREAIAGYTNQESLMRRLAAQQVRYQQSVAVPMGAGQAMLLTPQSIAAAGNATALAAQKFSIFNELVNGGSTAMLNWGKNTQWAGRQLMVGFTVPLMLFTAVASKQFRELDKELTRFQKVYGSDLGNAISASTARMREDVKELAFEISRTYGIAAKETAALAADIAATGAEGEQLLSSVQQTTRLAVLGEVDRQEAMKATLALQSAFKMSTTELAESINFLNAVENQTSATLEDLSIAIPKVGPVVRSLGGDIEDLSILLVAMREGGIPAAEAANALKSGLASLINPTKQASEVARQFGVDLVGIVEGNQGQLMPTIYAMKDALSGLDSFARARIIEQIFGKYQFARITALFDNIGRLGSQTQSVVELAAKSSAELAAVANGEIRVLTESTAVKFQRTLEELKNSIMPIGEAITETLIPIFEFIGKGVKMFTSFFQALPEPVKNFAKYGVAIAALAGPVIMLVGLFGNLIANGIKFGMMITRLGARVAGLKFEKFELLDSHVMAAKLGVDKLTLSFDTQEAALRRLTGVLSAYETSLNRLTRSNPALFIPGAIPGARGQVPIRRSKGSTSPEKVPGGYGGGDRIPALLEPGESVVTKEATSRYWPVISAMNKGKLPGFASGVVFLGMARKYQDVQQAKELRTRLSRVNAEATTGRFADLPVTPLGAKVTSIGGKSSSIPGINGVYEDNGQRYVVKTHDSADSALAEVRGSQLTRDIFGLKTPVQELIKIKHPITGDVVFAVRSPYDARFAASSGKIDEGDFFTQALASVIRRDKDLQPDNLYDGVVTDVGAAFVANKASQPRVIGGDVPSVQDQAEINFLMKKGGARKWFAEETASLAKSMTEQEYVSGFRTAIAKASANVRGAIDKLPYLDENERQMYMRLVKDLDDAEKIDWSAVYRFHKDIVPEVKRPPTAAAIAKKEAAEAERIRQTGDMAPWQYGLPLTFNTGGKVPGSGEGDKIPALLEPGEFVVTKKATKDYAPILHAMNKGVLQGFALGTPRNDAVDKWLREYEAATTGIGQGQVSLGPWDATRRARKSSAPSSIRNLGAPEDIPGVRWARGHYTEAGADVKSMRLDRNPLVNISWHPELWKFITDAENQLANTLSTAGAGSAQIRRQIEVALRDTGANTEKIDRIMFAITEGMMVHSEDIQEYENALRHLHAQGADITFLGDTLSQADILKSQGRPGLASATTTELRDAQAIQLRNYQALERRLAADPGNAVLQQGRDRIARQIIQIEDYLEKFGEDVGRLPETVLRSIREHSDQASPSREAERVGRNMSEGYLQGAESVDGRSAGEDLGKEIVSGAKSSKTNARPVGPGIESASTSQQIAAAEKSILDYTKAQAKFTSQRSVAQQQIAAIDAEILRLRQEERAGRMTAGTRLAKELVLLEERNKYDTELTRASRLEQMYQEKINAAKQRIAAADERQLRAEEEEARRAEARAQAAPGRITMGMLGGSQTDAKTLSAMRRVQAGYGKPGDKDLINQALGIQSGPTDSLRRAKDASGDIDNRRGMGTMALTNIMFTLSAAVSGITAMTGASEDAAAKIGMLTTAMMGLTTILSFRDMIPGGGGFLGLKAAGAKLSDLGAKKIPAPFAPTLGGAAAARGAGQSVGFGASTLLRGGAALSFMGSGPGIAIAAGLTAAVTGYMMYKKAADEARERAIAAFEDPAESAKYFGEEIKDLSRLLEERAGRFLPGDNAAAVDQGLRDIVKEEYAPLIEKVKYSNAEAGARELAIAYNSMLLNGLSSDAAKETLKAISVEAGAVGGQAYGEAFASNLFAADNAEQAIQEQLDRLNPENYKGLADKLEASLPQMQQGVYDAIDADAIDRWKQLGKGLLQISGVDFEKPSRGILDISRSLQNMGAGLTNVWQAFTGQLFDSTPLAQAADAASNRLDQIKNQIEEMRNLSADAFLANAEDFMKAYEAAPEAVVEAIQTSGEWMDDTAENLDIVKAKLMELNPLSAGFINLIGSMEDAVLAFQLTTMGIDLSRVFTVGEDGVIVFNSALAESIKLTQAYYDQQELESKESFDKLKENTVAFIDEEIKATKKGINRINDYFDSWKKIINKQERESERQFKQDQRRSEKFIDAKEDEIDSIQDALEASREAFDDKMQQYEDERKAIEDSSDAYIKSLQKNQAADSFYAQQRQTSLGALEKLASGDVFGFLQDREKMSADAQSFSYDTMIAEIEDRRDLELKAIDETMEKERRKQEEYEENQQKKIDLINDQIEAERELMDARQKAHEKELRQFDRKRKTIETNRKMELKDEQTKLSDLQRQRETAQTTELKDYQKFTESLGEEYKKRYGKEIVELQKVQYYIRFNALYQQNQSRETSKQLSDDQLMAAAFTQAFGKKPQAKVPIQQQILNMGLDPYDPNNPMYKPRTAANGGLMKFGDGSGGKVVGPGGPKSDVIPAYLSNGEYVVKASSVKAYGVPMMEAINAGKFANGGIVKASNGAYMSADQAERQATGTYLGGVKPKTNYSYTPGSSIRQIPWSENRPNLTSLLDDTPNDNYQARGKYANRKYVSYALEAKEYQQGYSGGKKWRENMSRMQNLGLNITSAFEEWRNLRRWEKEQFIRGLPPTTTSSQQTTNSTTTNNYPGTTPPHVQWRGEGTSPYYKDWWTNYESKAKAYLRTLPGGANRWMIEHFQDTDGHHSYRIIPRAEDNRPWWQKLLKPAYDDGEGHFKGDYNYDGKTWPNKGDKGTAVGYGWKDGGIVRGFREGGTADRQEGYSYATKPQTTKPKPTTYTGSTTNATSPYTYTPGWSPTPYKLPAQRYGPYGVGRIPGTRKPYNIPEFGRTADLSTMLASNYSHKLGAYATTSQHLEYLRKKASERQLLDGGGGKKWNIISSIISSSSPLARGSKERLANSARDIPTLDYWRTLSREQKAWFLEYASTGGTNNWSNSRVFKLMPWLPKETGKTIERGLSNKQIFDDRGPIEALLSYPNTATIGGANYAWDSITKQWVKLSDVDRPLGGTKYSPAPNLPTPDMMRDGKTGAYDRYTYDMSRPDNLPYPTGMGWTTAWDLNTRVPVNNLPRDPGSWNIPGPNFGNPDGVVRFRPNMTPATTRTSQQEQFPIGMSGLYLGQEDSPFSVGSRTSGAVGSILDRVLSERGSITRAIEVLTPEERSRLITELYLRSTGPQASLRSLNSEYGLSNNLGEMSLDRIVYNESLLRRFAEGGLVSLDENLLRQEGVSLNTAKNAVSYINNGGWPDNLTRLAFAIAMRESNGNANAFSRYSPTNSDTGLFQVNEAAYGKQPWFDLNRLKDGSYNAGVAYKYVSQGGTHFLPWALTPGFDGTNGWDWAYYANSSYFAPGSQARSETIRRTKLFWDAFKGSSGGNGTTDTTNNNSNETDNENYIIPERGLLGRLALIQRGEGGNRGGVPAPDGSYQPPVNTGNPDGVLAVAFAKQQLGEPYVADADGPDQWDCSGLTAAAYNVGVPDGYKKYSLVSYSTSQAERLKINVRRTSGTPGDGSMPEIQDNFNIGDILYFTNTGIGSSGKHVSMYAGNGQIIEAGDPVQMNPLNNDWNKKYFTFGGTPIAKFASGGFISGPGGPRSDMIPAMLSNGEYVVKASSVAKYGKGFMDQVNSGSLNTFQGSSMQPRMFADGGMVGSAPMPAFSMPAMADTSVGVNNTNYAGNSSSTRNNTKVKVVINGTGGKGANAIANKVISMINSANNRRNHSRSI